MTRRPPHLLLVEAAFYPETSALLRAGAEAELKTLGATYKSVSVPGALEIPPAIAMAHVARGYDGFVALGCVIRGETGHYDIVAGESARGLMNLATTHALAIGNGILTVDTEAQALARAAPDGANKGGGAVAACCALIALRVSVRTRQ